MRSILRWAMVAGTALATIATTTPAQAADARWELIASYQYADASWTLAGHVAGRPGNAHSGYFNFEGDDDGITAELYDWRCPGGVTPPTTPATATSCVVKASIFIQQPDFYNTFRFGQYLLRNRVQATVPVEDSLTGDVVDEQIDVRMRGLRPATRTVDYVTVDEGGESFRYRDVNLERNAVYRGHVSYVHFGDPRVHFTSAHVSRYDSYLRVPATG